MELETPAAAIEKANIEKWTVDPRYEFVRERGTVRLTRHKKTFSPEVLVKKDGVPIIMPHDGKPLRACEVMPERADIALDMDGNLLSQGNFTQNYLEWLSAWVLIEGSEVGLEPIPNVEQYVSMRLDPWRNGQIQHHFDPNKPAPSEIEAKYDTDGFTKEERESQSQSALISTLMKALVEKLDPTAAAELLTKVAEDAGQPIPIVGAEGGEVVSDEIGVDLMESVPPDWRVDEVKSDDPVAAPCGQIVKRRGFQQHSIRCNREACIEFAGDSHMTARGK